jgi:hypothetical protein
MMGTSVDTMFNELISEDYIDGIGVSELGILEVNGMMMDGWRWGDELVWRVGDEFLTVDIAEIEGMTIKGGEIVFGD